MAVQLVGKYQHDKSENLENYFAAIGVPYLVRKLIAASSPSMEITLSDDEEWCIKLHTLMKTVINNFKIGEEFKEIMGPGGTMMSIAMVDGDKLIINSTVAETGVRLSRTYTCTNEGCIIIMTHEGKTTAKRYYKRTN